MTEFLYKQEKQLKAQSVSDVKFDAEYDVVVCGLGVAGSIAMITAAKNGLKTLGIERFSSPGGTMTNGGVCGYYFGNKGGEYELVDKKIDEYAQDDAALAFKNGDLRKAVLHEEFALNCKFLRFYALCFEPKPTLAYLYIASG